MLSITTAAVLLCVVSGLFFLGLWLYYDRRDHRMFDAERRRTIYHCVKCDHIYGAQQRGDTVACPRCGHPNPRLHY